MRYGIFLMFHVIIFITSRHDITELPQNYLEYDSFDIISVL